MLWGVKALAAATQLPLYSAKYPSSCLGVVVAFNRCMVALVQPLCLQSQEKKKKCKDRAEYDLYESVAKTSDANTWLDTLGKWSRQYPETDYADIRRQMYLETYRTLDR